MIKILLFLCGCIAIIVFRILQHRFVYSKSTDLQTEEKQNQLDKILAIIMFVMAFINIFLPDLWGDCSWDGVEYLDSLHNPLFSVVRLFSASLVITIPIALLYHRKSFSRFVGFFGVPCFLANCIFAEKYMFYYQNACTCPFTELSRSFATNFGFRAIFFAIFELLKLFLILRIINKRREDFHFDNAKDLINFLFRAVLLLFVNMPITFPTHFTGSLCEGIVLESCNWVNLIWIIAVVLIITILTLVFRKKSYEDRYILLIVLSLSLLLQYCSFVQGREFTMATRLPVQLYNFACLFLPVAILLNKRTLLCFASIGNLMGAIAAVIICDTPGYEGLFYALNVHYIIEHTGIIVIGFLLMTLGIITPMQKKDLFSILKVFNAYFFFVLILGTIFNAIDASNNYENFIISIDPFVDLDFHCNYLFMFLEDIVADTAPALSVLYRTYLPIGQYARLQLSELVMYICFTLICVGPFFVFYAIFKEKKKTDNIIKQKLR